MGDAILQRIGTILQRVVKDDSGWSLIELLAVLGIMTVVLGAILGLLETSTRLAPQDRERALAIREGQVGVHRMVAELRQGVPAAGTTPSQDPSNQLDLVVKGVSIRYDCSVAIASTSYHQCKRYVINADGSLGTGVIVVPRLANGTDAKPVFYPNAAVPPTYYEVKVEVPEKGERSSGYAGSMVFNDGFYLRNNTATPAQPSDTPQ
jgi:type II secretory pathway pseudopilin PulG